jgi:hypothetical protein
VADLEVNVDMQNPASSEQTTEPSNPLTVVTVPQHSGAGEAVTADLLERVRLLEEKLAQTERIAQDAQSTAIQADMTATLATIENEPETPAVTELVIPESSDSGPKSEPEEKPKKGFLHHWI